MSSPVFALYATLSTSSVYAAANESMEFMHSYFFSAPLHSLPSKVLTQISFALPFPNTLCSVLDTHTAVTVLPFPHRVGSRFTPALPLASAYVVNVLLSASNFAALRPITVAMLSSVASSSLTALSTSCQRMYAAPPISCTSKSQSIVPSASTGRGSLQQLPSKYE